MKIGFIIFNYTLAVLKLFTNCLVYQEHSMKSPKVMTNQNTFTGEVPSESVVKAWHYRGDRHCEKNELSERRLQECKRNCNYFKQVDRWEYEINNTYKSEYPMFQEKIKTYPDFEVL